MKSPPDLIEALTFLTDLTKTTEPMTTFITREVNLYLDVLRVYGKRDKLSETDVHILCSRLLDLAQIAPLQGPEPGEEGAIPTTSAIPIDVDRFGKEIKEVSPVVKMYAPKKTALTEAPHAGL